jgi:hypothetical protein
VDHKASLTTELLGYLGQSTIQLLIIIFTVVLALQLLFIALRGRHLKLQQAKGSEGSGGGHGGAGRAENGAVGQGFSPQAGGIGGGANQASDRNN